LKQVRRIEIASARTATDVFAGAYQSAFRGQGIEFDEVREYTPGDDVRAIDWNVTARAGKPFMKRYIEERELTILLLVDTSASLRFGSVGRLESEIAAELCALLAFAAVRKNDKVGAILFSNGIDLHIPARKGRRHALRLVRELLTPPATAPRARGTDLAGALEYALRVQKRRAVIFVVSDFLDEGYEKALRAAASKHDVVACEIVDPRTLSLEPVGLVPFEDAETGAVRLIDTSNPRVRRALAACAASRREKLKKRLVSAGVDRIEVRTDESYADALVELFHRREKRRSR
jgi:uncharacterized protein (DUF58 family)